MFKKGDIIFYTGFCDPGSRLRLVADDSEGDWSWLKETIGSPPFRGWTDNYRSATHAEKLEWSGNQVKSCSR